GADAVRELEVALEQLQQTAKPCGSTVGEWRVQGELEDPALRSADPAGAICPRRCGQLSFEIGEPALQRDPAQLRRVSVKLPQLLDLPLDGLVHFWCRRSLCLRCHDCLSFRSSSIRTAG